MTAVALDGQSWLALRPGSWLPVQGIGVLWSADDGDTRVWLEPGSEAVLQSLQRFDRWESHRLRLAPLLADPARAEGALRALASRGLLMDAAACLASVDERPTAAPSQPPLVAIRSHRRPRALARLLQGLRDHEARFGARRRHLVIDDTPEGDPQVAEVVAAERRQGLLVRVLSARHRRDWLTAIARRIPAWGAPGPLRALLDPCLAASTGARAWNAAVLFGAGATLTLLDDDFHLPWRARAPNPGIELSGSARTNIRYHIRGEPPEPAADFDVIEHAHRLCGRSPHEAGAACADDVAGLTAAQVLDWRARRVGAVISGTYGAYAWDSSVFINLAAALAPDGTLWTEPFDERRLEADAVSVAVDRPTLLHHGNFTPLALDLGEFAPFASTVGKADDVAFLHLLGAVRARHCVVEVPWLVGHAPPEPRRRRAAAESPLIADPNVLFGARVAHVAMSIEGGEPASRWKALCGMADAMANADDDTLLSVARRWRMATLAQVVGMANRALTQCTTAPPAWREHATRILEANQLALTGADDGLGVLVQGLRTAMTQLAHGDAWAAVWSLAEREAAEWYEALDAR